MALRCRRVGAVHSINRVGLATSEALPLYPSKPTFAARIGRSEKCCLDLGRLTKAQREKVFKAFGPDKTDCIKIILRLRSCGF